MKESRLDQWQQFLTNQKKRMDIKLSTKLQAMMDNCQYILHGQFDKNTKPKNKNKKRYEELSPQYREAFKTLSRDQKLSYYLRFMKLICDYTDGKLEQPMQFKGMFSSDVFSRSFNLKMWKLKRLRLDRQKNILFAQKDNKIKTYILQDYILRKSKNKQYYCFVLQAINTNPHQKSRTVHLGFKDQLKFNQWMKELGIVYAWIQWKFVSGEMKNRGTGTGNRTMTQSQVLNKSLGLNSQRSINNRFQQQNILSKSAFFQPRKGQQSPPKNIQKYPTISSIPQKSPTSKSQASTPQISPIKKQKQAQQLDQSYEIKQQQIFFSGSSDQQQFQNSKSPVMKNRRTIIEQIAKIDDIEEIEAIAERDKEKDRDGNSSNEVRENIFHRILPDYYLEQLDSTVNYGTLLEEPNLKIYGHLKQPQKIKTFITVTFQYPQPNQSPQKQLLNLLTQPDTLKQTNSQIEQFSLKTMIKSQNSAMMYLKIKAYNKIYRPRDFIFLRHVFKAGEDLHIVDKSIQSITYPPFTTIVRGQLVVLWRIRKMEEKKYAIVADLNINNQGYLNDSQNVNLVLKYLKGFSNIEKVAKKKQQFLEELNLFNDKWNIVEQTTTTNGKSNQNQYKKKEKTKKNSIQIADVKQNQQIAFKKKKTQTESNSNKSNNSNNANKKQINDLELKQNSNNEKVATKPSKASNTSSPNPKQTKTEKQKQQKIESTKQLIKKYSHMQQQRGQIDLQQAQNNQKLKTMTVHGIKREFDDKGYVIVSQNFVKTRYITSPLPKKQLIYQEVIEGHPIWKGEWIHDDKVGGIIFINEKKIQDQKGVLKFILTKIGKNLLSGKSVLNISLPVDIFCAESNLERLIYSLTYAPTHLQPAVKQKNPLQRLKKIIAFGISNSPLYLNMQKPFNPILGETFQCWIDGCPVYAQQISHHPPIAALMYEGRGFRMVAQLESKVQLHMNSGCGTNQGVFRIKFEDGMQGCYITPGGQVSGLTYGDRKFNMVGKSYYWIQSQCLFLELIFNPTKKGFFSVGKQEQPIDYFQGYVCKVKPQFMQSFNKKRRAPLQKQIQQKYGKVCGIWNKFTQYNDQTILNIEKQFPAKLQYQANPLPSDANWRQDIAYRRILQISKSQSEKQRLEILQRKDRKLRESNPNYQHHKK